MLFSKISYHKNSFKLFNLFTVGKSFSMGNLNPGPGAYGDKYRKVKKKVLFTHININRLQLGSNYIIFIFITDLELKKEKECTIQDKLLAQALTKMKISNQIKII